MAMSDHPKTGDRYDCPHCMKAQITQFETYIDFVNSQEN